jgi:hypothetical protein
MENEQQSSCAIVNFVPSLFKHLRSVVLCRIVEARGFDVSKLLICSPRSLRIILFVSGNQIVVQALNG